MINFVTTAAADFKFQTTFSGTATVKSKYSMAIAANGGGGPFYTLGQGTHIVGTAIGSLTGGGMAEIEITLVVTVSGTFAVQWAQNTTDANNTTVCAGSFIEYMSVA
jgi:hypothetical protein